MRSLPHNLSLPEPALIEQASRVPAVQKINLTQNQLSISLLQNANPNAEVLQGRRLISSFLLARTRDRTGASIPGLWAP